MGQKEYIIPKNPDLPIITNLPFLRGGAEKPLARPGRKEVTTPNSGFIQHTPPRSSVHFLARCCNFCKLAIYSIR
jgi:hypothetical protein